MFDWKWYLRDLKSPNKNVKVFSCFSCGGGSSMGYKRAGFDVVGNVEIDPQINKNYVKNLKPKYNYCMDLRDFNRLENLPVELYGIDILDGSPPCTTFSMAGKRERYWGKAKKFREGQKIQTLDDLFFVWLETVEKLKPKIAIAENVVGLIQKNARGYVNEILTRFKKLGYEVQMFRLNAALMDVPQARERIFFIANNQKYPKLKLEFQGKPINFGEVRTEKGIPVKEGTNIKRYIDNALPSDMSIADVALRLDGRKINFNHRIMHDDRVAFTLVNGGSFWRFCDRIMELFKKHTHSWHVKISIITADKLKSRVMERGVPSPEQRLDAIKRLSDIGIHVTLRLRPYIIGVSEDWQDLIFLARQAGADSVTVEFFCMEARADDELKSRYAEMSDICNFDIWDFYIKYSPQHGYKRLDRKIKAPIIYKMRDYAHKLGMRFHVSDSYCRECNDSCNCCGVPPEWNVSQKGHIGQAIIIGREKGFVKFSDLADKLNIWESLRFKDLFGFNKSTTFKSAMCYYMTVKDFIRNNWNNIQGEKSPARMYGGILIPFDVDDNGDVVYKFNEKMWRRNAEKSKKTVQIQGLP